MPKIIGLLEAGRADGKLVNAKNVYDNNQGKNQQEINELLLAGTGSGILPPLTQEEYYALETKEWTLYFIVNEGVLEKIYYGTTLIARREAQETTVGFPIIFPLIFN